MFTTNYFLNIFIFCNKLYKQTYSYSIYFNILHSVQLHVTMNPFHIYNTNLIFFYKKFSLTIRLKKKKFLKILIFLLKTKFIKNGHRFKQLQYNFLPANKYVFFLKKRNLLNNFYHRKRNKKILHYPQFKYNLILLNPLFMVISLFKLRYQYIVISKNRYGSNIVTPLIDTITFGQTFSFYKNLWKFIFFLNIGSIFLLKYITVWCVISNIGLIKSQWIKSFGTFGVIENQYDTFTKIQLPSGSSKVFNSNLIAVIGRNAGKLHYKEYKGKASFNLSNKSIKVRSIAKNPIDHPNGGRTPGKSPKKTPWGLIAKKNK